MTTVASKNLYDLLGNDVEDENEVPKAPVVPVTKQTTTSKKKDEPPVTSTVTSSHDTNARGHYNRRGRGDGNEAAYRDRGAGRNNNRTKPTDETGAVREQYGSDRPYRARGGGAGRGRGRPYDRHSQSNRTDTDKQVSQGWGANTGPGEWGDEQAGESIAQAEANDEAAATTDAEIKPANEDGEAPAETERLPTPEPEDRTKSYAQYLAEKAAKAPVDELPQARAPNENARDAKKWAAAKELVKEEDEEYFAGGKTKQKNAKQRKEKAVVEIDQRFVDPRDSNRRGGGDRGDRGGRGGRGRGDRGDRGDRPPRGRGEFRGGRGAPRGGAGSGLVNVQDESAFPSLGGK